MDENIPGKSSINGVKVNLFNNNSACKINDKKAIELLERETKVNLKLSNNALVKSISGPSKFHQKSIHSQNKRVRKGKSKVISVVNLSKPVDHNVQNRHIPLILKKSKMKTKRAISDLVTSISGCSILQNSVSINSVRKEVVNISNRQMYHTANNDQITIGDELANSGGIQNQVIPYQQSQQLGSLTNNLDLQVGNNSVLPQNPIITTSTVKNEFAIKEPIVEFIPNCNNEGLKFESVPNLSNMIIPMTNQSAITLKNEVNMNRMVSILKPNQTNLHSGVIEGLASNNAINIVTIPFGAESSSESDTSDESGESSSSSEFEKSLIINEESSVITNTTSNEETDVIETNSPERVATTSEFQIKEVRSEPESKADVSMEDEVEAKNKSSGLITVASDDIPYNAEVEIDGNSVKSVESLNVDVGNTNENANIDDVVDDGVEQSEELTFERFKKFKERKLFLENADRSFFTCALHRAEGIRQFGYRGFKAVQKLNYVLNLVPDESPATVHALLIACKNRVVPTLAHLRYIQRCRKFMQTTKTQTPSSSSSSQPSLKEKRKRNVAKEENATPAMHVEEGVASTSTSTSSISTRKKKISYDLDLSDNYADDSDEDYVPGKDFTPRKKKKRTNRRRYLKRNESATAERESSLFYECPVHKPFVNNVNYGQEASTSTSRNILDDVSNVPMDIIENNDKPVIDYRNSHGKKRKGGIFEQSATIYKAEPLRKECLELVQYKKKRISNSHIVPPLQKYIYVHEAQENFRYMALSKQ